MSAQGAANVTSVICSQRDAGSLTWKGNPAVQRFFGRTASRGPHHARELAGDGNAAQVQGLGVSNRIRYTRNRKGQIECRFCDLYLMKT
jgi:hypothetical protein